jgi:hypothetical protein
MNSLPYLKEIFQKLRLGHHLSPEDEPLFSAMTGNYDAYVSYFAPLGLTLIRHPREFFYFEPEENENMRETLARIAVFAFILIDDTANAGRPIEDFLLNNHFLVSKLPHFGLDRYANLLRQVEVEDTAGLRQILRNMERFGWVKFLTDDEFRLLRPFHRIFDKCLELSKDAATAENTGRAAGA